MRRQLIVAAVEDSKSMKCVMTLHVCLCWLERRVGGQILHCRLGRLIGEDAALEILAAFPPVEAQDYWLLRLKNPGAFP